MALSRAPGASSICSSTRPTMSFNMPKNSTLTRIDTCSLADGPGPAAVSVYNPTMSVHQTRLRVRYAETDQMGVVYYANYLVWMEVARVEYCKSVGFSYEEMERDDGVFLAVAEAHCRYLYPARFDQEILVETSLADAHPRMVRFSYEMRSAGDGR